MVSAHEISMCFRVTLRTVVIFEAKGLNYSFAPKISKTKGTWNIHHTKHSMGLH
jgi:hypothetical protein